MITVWIDSANTLHEQRVEQNLDLLDDTDDTHSSDTKVVSNEDNAIEKETSTNAATQSLSLADSILFDDGQAEQESNHSNNPDNTSPHKDGVTVSETDIAEEKETHIDPEIQHLLTDNSIPINKDQTERETSLSESTPDSVDIKEDNIAAEEERNIGFKTQHLSVQETNLSDVADNNASSDANAIAAESDNTTEEDANLAAKTQHLATQEAEPSDNTNDISHAADLLAEDDIVAEEEKNIGFETQYLSVQESNLSDDVESSACSDAEAENESEQKPNHSNITDTAAASDTSNMPAEKETIAEIENQYLPISDSIPINNKRAAQETNNSDATNDTSIPNTASLLTENTAESKKHCTLDYDIEEIRGIGEECGQYLRQISIGSTRQLLKQAGNAASVSEISLLVKKEESLIQAWISMADLVRIPGIRGQFAELIALSGVLSVKQLATQDANDLIEKIYNAYRLVQKNRGATAKADYYCAKPNIDMVSTWIDSANTLTNED